MFSNEEKELVFFRQSFEESEKEKESEKKNWRTGINEIQWIAQWKMVYRQQWLE